MNSNKNHYELWFGIPTLVKYFRVFGSKCYIKREDDNLGKFDSRTDEGIFLGYSSTKRAYRSYNIKSHKIIESENVTVDDTNSRIQIQVSEDVEHTDDEEINDKQKEESSQEEDSLS